MGVQARIVLYAPDRERAHEGAAAAFAEIARLDAIMSDYRPESELMRLSAAAPGEKVLVSDDLFRALQVAQEISEKSGGAFDVTVGPLTKLWRAVRQRGHLPTEEQLEQASSRTGRDKIAFDELSRSVRLLGENMLLDLGGIAKGYAADRAVKRLRAARLNRCLVALAGDIALGDSPPEDKGWLIEVPLSPAPKQLRLSNCCVSTSGDLEQFIEIDGVRYSHIIDPRNGVGVTNRIMVTVIAAYGEYADALASACSVLGWPDARELTKKFPDAAYVFEWPLENGVRREIIDDSNRLDWE